MIIFYNNFGQILNSFFRTKAQSGITAPSTVMCEWSLLALSSVFFLCLGSLEALRFEARMQLRWRWRWLVGAATSTSASAFSIVMFVGVGAK